MIIILIIFSNDYYMYMYNNYTYYLFSAPDDFIAESKVLLFPRNAETICTTFSITDNNVIEGNETFEVTFSTNFDIPLPPVNITVLIIDDDCKSMK